MHPERGTKVILGAALFALCVAAFTVQVAAQEATAAPRDTLLAVAKDIMAQTRFCVLVTLDGTGHPRARAMDPFMPDENWVIWMGTGPGTRKAMDIQKDPRVTLYYDHPSKAGYVVVYGTAKLVDDPELKNKWFKEEWARFYPDKEKGYVLIAVTPKRMEVLDYTRGVMGDETTWVPPSVTF